MNTALRTSSLNKNMSTEGEIATVVGNDRLERARLETANYHKLYYSQHKLFEEKSWLAQPDSDLMKLLEEKLTSGSDRIRLHQSQLRILDLGCGVGRNAVPMAQALHKAQIEAEIIAVDLLHQSIDLLNQNSSKHRVGHLITGIVADNDEFVIEPQSYDLIAAISVIEHCAGKANVRKLLNAIADGLKPGGIAKIEMTTDRNVVDLDSQLPVPTYVETPLTESEVLQMLCAAFVSFAKLSSNVFPYQETLEGDGKRILWRSKQVSFAARAPL
jgi:2-polyprenyl-3-methyl-5-hydroxy-6-metoxy-1,4-benzoquinol methylase